MAATLPLFTTYAEPAPYEVVAVAEPATPGWLNLPAIHAKLLPLALAAGHERLTLTCDFAGEGDFQCTYCACASGDKVGFRSYIGPFDMEGGHLPEQFEQVLRAKLQKEAERYATRQHLRPTAQAA